MSDCINIDQNDPSGISGINTEITTVGAASNPKNHSFNETIAVASTPKTTPNPETVQAQNNKTHAGQQRQIVFAGLAYNCDSTIADLIHFVVTRVASAFQDYRFLILESNSTDKTRAKILEYIEQHNLSNRVTLLTENHTKRIADHARKMKQFGFQPNPNARYRKMGILRNILLREYRKLSTTFKNDYFVMMDLDIAGFFSAHAFLARLALDTQTEKARDELQAPSASSDTGKSSAALETNASSSWDAIACFGLNVHPRKKWFPCSEGDRVIAAGTSSWMYYDQLAFRDMTGSNKCMTWPSVNLYTLNGISYINDCSAVESEMRQVQSAFSGLCVYKSKLLVNTNVQYNETSDANECEHVTFHKRLKNFKSDFKLYVDTNLLLFYKPAPMPLTSLLNPIQLPAATSADPNCPVIRDFSNCFCSVNSTIELQTTSKTEQNQSTLPVAPTLAVEPTMLTLDTSSSVALASTTVASTVSGATNTTVGTAASYKQKKSTSKASRLSKNFGSLIQRQQQHTGIRFVHTRKRKAAAAHGFIN